MKLARYAVCVLPHSAASVRATVRAGFKLADEDALSRAELCFFTVPDGQLAAIVADVVPSLSARCAVIHCAGALTLEDLGPRPVLGGRPRASFHPLCAISGPLDPLAGCSVALSTRSPAVMKALERLAKSLALHPLRVAEKSRAAYHAGAVMSAGGTVALVSSAVEALRTAGISEADAVTALLPLVASALRGIQARGLTGALTGPVLRGDTAVLARHVKALPRDVLRLYRPLMARMLMLAQPQLTPSQRREIAALAQE